MDCKVERQEYIGYSQRSDNRKVYKGSSFPSQSMIKDTYRISQGVLELPQIRSLPDLELRLNQLEERAKVAEEYRMEKEKQQKFDMESISFPSDKAIPKVRLELQEPEIVFPSQLITKSPRGKKGTFKIFPFKINKEAILPTDPEFTDNIELIEEVTKDNQLEEGEAEYRVRIDSQGRKIKLCCVKYRSEDTSSPILTTLLTTRELKSRARILAYAQYKKQNKAKLAKPRSLRLLKLRAIIRVVILFNRLKRDCKKKMSSRVSRIGGLDNGIKRKLSVINALPESSRNDSLNGLSEVPQIEVNELLSSLKSDSSDDLIQAEQLYVDVEGLKNFLSILEKVKGGSEKKVSNKIERKNKAQRLEYLFLKSEYMNAKREKELQQEALKKAFKLY